MCVLFQAVVCSQASPSSPSSPGRLRAVARQSVPKFSEQTCSSLPSLICNVQPTAGNNVRGTVYFTPAFVPRSSDSDQFACFTRVTASVSGLTGPLHGFHIHTYGDLSEDDGSSTGGHFTNPAGDDIRHGLPDDEVRHWGDFGNLEVGEDGIAEYDRVDDVIRLGGIVGRAITIHAENDKGVDEQPSGASGSRVGYCVIGFSNPEVQSSA
ncbi:copper-zinc superoxide dismutase CuZn SOD1 [Gracilaria domingensis]|nr:copper-zinc superoxide dismutase CuZn SOD1 [Gracilaria domingensis]